MADFAGLKAQLEAMGDELLADPSTPPRVLAFLHMWKASNLLGATEPPTLRELRPAFVPERSALMRAVVLHSRGLGKSRRQMDPDRKRVLDTAAEVIRGVEIPMPTSTIFHALGDVAQLIGGAEPKSNLSAMLHHSPMFVSHGRRGWTLANDISAPDTTAENRSDASQAATDFGKQLGGFLTALSPV